MLPGAPPNLTDWTKCPNCGADLRSQRCGVCGLDLVGALGAELARLSVMAEATLKAGSAGAEAILAERARLIDRFVPRPWAPDMAANRWA
ncbi:MAG: hypothetical protein LBO20_05545, partial [Bifidobacteriaceae bacterium]|nr:hypothetical protein [Bifidobacteriaceae bacterium]